MRDSSNKVVAVIIEAKMTTHPKIHHVEAQVYIIIHVYTLYIILCVYV